MKYEYKYTFTSNEPLGVDERQNLLDNIAKFLPNKIERVELKEMKPEVLEMPRDEHWQWRDE